MKIEVFKFNQKRNGFAVDRALELNMLKEEAREFFDAATTAERLDAYIDFQYVLAGTRMKVVANGMVIDDDLKEWVSQTMDIMFEVLKDEFDDIASMSVAEIKAEKIVCDINAIKSNDLDENGKVKKQKNLPNATEQIAKMLEKDFGIKG